MTISRDDRLQNMELALRVMLGRLGERAMYKELFSPGDPAFSEVYPTSWKELEDRGLVRGHHMSTSNLYELIGPGWYLAMAISDGFEKPDFQAQFGRLSAALKASVKGRQERQVTTVRQLVDETNLPEDWIYNVIESNVWKHHYNRVGAQFDHDVVWVPIDFNMEPL